jgi:hypothetical protein
MTRRVVSVLALIGILLLLVWQASEVLLVVFAGVLLALFLRGGGDWLARRTGLSGGWGLLLLVAARRSRIKRRTRPMLGFKRLVTARRTLAGVEVLAMLAKGQVRAAPANEVPAQRAFVHQLFGLAA